MQAVKLKIHGETARLHDLKAALEAIPGVVRVDVNESRLLIRALSEQEPSLQELTRAGERLGVRLQPVTQEADHRVQTIVISGMTCHSCEIKIEKALRSIPGVHRVDADTVRGRAQIHWGENAARDGGAVRQAIERAGYSCGVGGSVDAAPRPSWTQLAAMLALVLMLGWIANRIGLLQHTIGVGATVSIGAAFILGLVAASSSCLAVSGGVMLGLIAKYQARFLPVAMFVAGRVLAYAVLGGIIGLVGKALSPSPTVTGIITVVAALYMFVMGLQMVGRAPRWLLRILPRMPKRLGHIAAADREGSHPLMTAGVGTLTFFLPCGFTQSLQLYALTTGSMVTSGLVLGSFALGTAPALLALGLASSKLQGNAQQMFYRFAGALVLVLGVWNFQNGLVIAGYPLRFPSLSLGQTAAAADGTVTYDGATQVVNIRVDNAGYTPNYFALKANEPARLVIDGPLAGQGCLGVFQIPKLGIVKRLTPGSATSIEFTPTSGEYAFSCSMGMYRGSFSAS